MSVLLVAAGGSAKSATPLGASSPQSLVHAPYSATEGWRALVGRGEAARGSRTPSVALPHRPCLVRVDRAFALDSNITLHTLRVRNALTGMQRCPLARRLRSARRPQLRPRSRACTWAHGGVSWPSASTEQDVDVGLPREGEQLWGCWRQPLTSGRMFLGQSLCRLNGGGALGVHLHMTFYLGEARINCQVVLSRLRGASLSSPAPASVSFRSCPSRPLMRASSRCSSSCSDGRRP